jgi:hypothetical protein
MYKPLLPEVTVISTRKYDPSPSWLHDKKVIAHLIGGFLCGVVEPWWPCFPESRRCGLLVVLATRAIFAAEEAGSRRIVLIVCKEKYAYPACGATDTMITSH